MEMVVRHREVEGARDRVSSCTEARHRALKVSYKTFTEATQYVGLMPGLPELPGALELRNCRHCRSTLGWRHVPA
jgi:hypothetical protein